ncbi:TIR domain-containing protein [Zobellia alginiliquefaciens]|uniref:TIR domain-containing protein n=1 Tax=Zobellia alginiliquefaciens TaxID=3032586 RepID=UPI0023E0AAE4|nr:TIR domain-containing protein [Zobellia alginiliquefaciens]
MKPKIFIGSSVEGLNVAYAIQQNLTYDADVTVWDQGVFELSKTTIESLMKVLENSDFGIFVFNPDDLLKIRADETSVVRDNVIFEMGLFIGKLSRERVYFLKPMKGELHIPSDLLGIISGDYDSEREDGSIQAATGPFCNQVRQQVQKLGTVTLVENNPQNPDEKNSALKDDNWYSLFLDRKYGETIEKLNSLIRKEKVEEEKLNLMLWKIYCEFKTGEKNGLKKMDAFMKKHESKRNAYIGLARIYQWEEYFDKSEATIELGLKKFKNDSSLIAIRAENQIHMGETDSAIQLLEKHNPSENVEIAIHIYNIHFKIKSYDRALDVIHVTYLNFPNNEQLRYKYALVAIELEKYHIALFLLNSLVSEFPKNMSYWGYLSNTALQLDFYDLALSSNRKAEELSESKESWILSNTGNMLYNKGFYSESITYFNKSISISKESDYAHGRLASAVKDRQKEKEEINQKCKEGRISIRDYKIEAST